MEQQQSWGHTPEGSGAMDLGSLRRKVRCHLDQHMYESAVFLADKLVTMSGGHEDDVYTLAQAYFRAGLHHRAIYTVVEAGLVERHSPTK